MNDIGGAKSIKRTEATINASDRVDTPISFKASVPAHVNRNTGASKQEDGMKDWAVPGEVPPPQPPVAAGNSRPAPKPFNPAGRA